MQEPGARGFQGSGREEGQEFGFRVSGLLYVLAVQLATCAGKALSPQKALCSAEFVRHNAPSPKVCLTGGLELDDNLEDGERCEAKEDRALGSLG